MQGVLVQSDANDWLRLELLGNNGNVYLYGAKTTNGSTSTLVYTQIPASASSTIRVTRTGTSYTLATAGTDNTTFTNRATFNWNQPVTAIGPYAGNAFQQRHHRTRVHRPGRLLLQHRVPHQPRRPHRHPRHPQPHHHRRRVRNGVPTSGTYNPGTTVTLTATPTTGSTFTGWSGDCTGTGNLPITMNTDGPHRHLPSTNTTRATHTLTTTGVGAGTAPPASAPTTTHHRHPHRHPRRRQHLHRLERRLHRHHQPAHHHHEHRRGPHRHVPTNTTTDCWWCGVG